MSSRTCYPPSSFPLLPFEAFGEIEKHPVGLLPTCVVSVSEPEIDLSVPVVSLLLCICPFSFLLRAVFVDKLSLYTSAKTVLYVGYFR